MWRYFLGWALDAGEHLSESPRSDLASRWLGGGLAAGALAGYALNCIVMQRAYFPRTRPLGLIEHEGTAALLVGAIYLSCAAFAHFHWFWSGEDRWHVLGHLGKFLSLIAFMVALGAFLYHEFWLR